MKLSTTMGMELTYTPTILQAVSEELDYNWNGYELAAIEEALVDVKRGQLKNALKNKGILKNFVNVHTDPGVVEVPTKPQRNLEAFLKIVREANAVAKSVGLSPKLPYTTGGGAHIHMGLPKNDEQRHAYKVELANLVAKYPVMSWAFTDLSDDINASPIRDERLLDRDWNNRPMVFDGSKDYALRFSHFNTAELRFFEMGDLAQLKRNILFADAVNRRALALASATADRADFREQGWTYKTLQRLTKAQALTMFDDMLKELGLSGSMFKPQREHLAERMDRMKRGEVSL